MMSEIEKDDILFKFILKCQKNYNKMDLHSFVICVEKGKAFVECRQYEVYIEIHTIDNRIKWVGTAIAAANLLDLYKADYTTIDM